MELLLLHPLPLDGSIFPAELRGLAARCAAPTLYGCGDDLRNWARAALDQVGDGPLVVVGNSIGGSVGVEVVKLVPERVAALVLVGAKPGHRPEPDLRDEAVALLDAGDLRAAWDRWWRPLFGPTAPTEVIERGWQVADGLGPAAIARGVRAFHGRRDRGAFLASWPGRTVVVSGEHDLWPDRARQLAADLPNATFRLVEGVGHYLPLEDPAALTAIVADVIGAAVGGAPDHD